MSKKFSFPKWLEMTPEREAEEAKVQELRRASFGRANLTREEELVSRGALLEQTARGNLAAIQADKEAAPISAIGLEARKEELDRQEADELTKLAYALSLQGRFEEARNHVPIDEMKAHYQGIIDAIELDDTEKCKCEDSKGKIGETEIAITPRFVTQEVFSQKHGKVVSLVVCNVCGHQNARTPNSRIPIRDAAMKQNLASAQANTGRGFKSDAELLKVK